MNDFHNDLPDEAARMVLVWRMAQIRAELTFALGFMKTQARDWAQRCHTAGVRFKLPHAAAVHAPRYQAWKTQSRTAI
jgi:hypothetical protein